MRTANPALEIPGLLPRIGAGHARRHAVAILGVGAFAFVLLRSMTAAVAGTEPGSPRCVHARAASTTDYMTGRVCPPGGFAAALGYEPMLVRTPYGWRYTKPAFAGGSCSGPIREHGPFWDFGAACRMHDYGYDLVRFGVAERPDADRLLYRDMKASCLEIGLVERPACKVLADTSNAVLTVGDVTGFDVDRLPEGAAA
ncbi:MAG TPA: hypothetical protein VFT27_11040 [Actinomycetota bacterium]|nr:hypothetical protein [Actinomycetota bacterium]